MSVAVTELLDVIVDRNQIDPAELVNVIFSVTPDLDAVFPAQIARQRPGWGHVPFIDVQHMQVPGSLPRCIRVLLQLNCGQTQAEIHHVYLRQAKVLRPDLG
jgi:chorismate mutase